MRKVRSVIELLLGARRSSGRGAPRPRPAVDDIEALLRTTLLDWTSATLVGVVGLARRAAAAAAEEREGDWVSRRMKAEAAAVAALGLAVSLVRGCKNITTALVSRSSPVRRLRML